MPSDKAVVLTDKIKWTQENVTPVHVMKGAKIYLHYNLSTEKT
jgi:hypothetical protein